MVLQIQIPTDAAGVLQAEYSDLLSVRLALCVPSTCSAPVVQAGLNGLLARVSGLANGTGIRLLAELSEEYTSVASGWRQPVFSDWAVM